MSRFDQKSTITSCSWRLLAIRRATVQRLWSVATSHEPCTSFCSLSKICFGLCRSDGNQVPTSSPDHFTALIARRDRLQQTEWETPELLFDVRNKVIHPPRRLSDPEWPNSDEMIESWQFATWALQLVLLRLFG